MAEIEIQELTEEQIGRTPPDVLTTFFGIIHEIGSENRILKQQLAAYGAALLELTGKVRLAPADIESANLPVGKTIYV